MSPELRDLFPLGDIDETVVAAVADRFPVLPATDVIAALALAGSVLRLLEEVPAPVVAVGLSPARWRLLIALIAQTGPDGARIGELAEHLGVREPTITATVDRAEADGLVSRSRDSRDGRIVRVAITERGQATVAAVIPELATRMSVLVGALGGPVEVAQLAGRIDAAVGRLTAGEKE